MNRCTYSIKCWLVRIPQQFICVHKEFLGFQIERRLVNQRLRCRVDFRLIAKFVNHSRYLYVCIAVISMYSLIWGYGGVVVRPLAFCLLGSEFDTQ